ncbi:MAG: helix-turn-helix domain-containing protein [Acidobacteria bacterium]|nr:helix-turn-helix domain-containing protein [Acidobacteriota bacterium]
MIENHHNEELAPQTQEIAERDRSFSARWKYGELFARGWLPVPSQFLFHYAKLKPHLTATEAMFVLQLMSFKWTSEPPFPNCSTIAKRMGVTDKMIRRYAKSLVEKKYLVRTQRNGRSNSYDLTPLFNALRGSMYAQPDASTEEEAAF